MTRPVARTPSGRGARSRPLGSGTRRPTRRPRAGGRADSDAGAGGTKSRSDHDPRLVTPGACSACVMSGDLARTGQRAPCLPLSPCSMLVCMIEAGDLLLLSHLAPLISALVAESFLICLRIYPAGHSHVVAPWHSSIDPKLSTLCTIIVLSFTNFHML